MLGEVQHLGCERFPGAEPSLLLYKDMFDNWRQAVLYQALVHFVEVTQKGNWSEVFGLDGPFTGFRRATTRACLHSLGKRCVIAQALSRLHCHGSEVLDLLSQHFVESSSFPVFHML